MRGTFVDTSVLLDVLTNDRAWADWSERQLDAAALHGALIINDIIYAELAVGFATVETLDGFVVGSGLTLAAMPRAALFLAATAFEKYRARGGARTGVLPDFFIGAHAAVLDAPLLTRDMRRYRTYFPKLRLIAP
jgi:hypothetical protein